MTEGWVNDDSFKNYPFNIDNMKNAQPLMYDIFQQS